MRRIYTFIVFLILFCVALPASAQEQAAPSAAPKTIEEKLQKTRELMREPRESPSQAHANAEEDLGSSGMRMVQSLGVLIAMVLFGAWAYKKFILKDAPVISRKIKIIERCPLAPRASVLLAEIEGEKIIIGLSADGISMMKLDQPSTSAPIKLTEEYAHA